MERQHFKELAAGNVNDEGPVEMESLCMDCEKNGTTRLLLTKIPLFKEVIVSSFSCPHCGASNSSIQSGAAIEPKGVKCTFTVKDPEHLNRLVVKADTATVCIPELDFEIPPLSMRGSITTVENILLHAVEDLGKEQPTRKALHPDLAEKLDRFIVQLRDCVALKKPFVLVVDDPAGNSFIENKHAPEVDPCLDVEHYLRSEQQDKQLGASAATPSEVSSDTAYEGVTGPVGKDEVVEFPTNCYQCNSPADTRMKQVDIPHFKQVIIMATTCNYCGYRSNEVKSGSGVSETGTRIKLRIMNISDLNRDVVLSETCVLHIPSLDFECSNSRMGGRFTTVEGTLVEVKDQLQRTNPFLGDSVPRSQLTSFLERLSEIIDGRKLDVDIMLDDPAGNSFIQDTCAPEVDHGLTVVHYDRTYEQNDQLGLNDMKTDDYTHA